MRTLTKVSERSIQYRSNESKRSITFNLKEDAAKYAGLVFLFVLMFFMATPTFAQEKKKEVPVRKIDAKEMEKRKKEGRIVKGKVLFNAEGLPGVTILLKGTNKGIDSDLDGNFRFPIALLEGDILVFSSIGFDNKEVKLDKQTNYLNVKMVESTEVLELIVLDAPQTTKLFKSSKKGFKKTND